MDASELVSGANRILHFVVPLTIDAGEAGRGVVTTSGTIRFVFTTDQGAKTCVLPMIVKTGLPGCEITPSRGFLILDRSAAASTQVELDFARPLDVTRASVVIENGLPLVAKITRSSETSCIITLSGSRERISDVPEGLHQGEVQFAAGIGLDHASFPMAVFVEK